MDVVTLPNDGLVLFGVGALIPPVVSFLTKWHAPDWLKKFITALLSVASAAVAEGVHAIQNNESWSYTGLITSAIIAWLAANFTYSKFWQDNPVNDAIVKATGNFGISIKPTEWPFPEPKPTDVGQPAVQAPGTTVAVGDVPTKVMETTPPPRQEPLEEVVEHPQSQPAEPLIVPPVPQTPVSTGQPTSMYGLPVRNDG